MFNITGEFGLGVIMNFMFVDFFIISSGLVMMDDSLLFISDRSEVFGGSIDGDIEFDVLSSMAALMVENLGLGLATEGASAALFIVGTMVEGGSCIVVNMLALINRGLRLIELLVADADAMGALLSIFEIASFIMRPVSIAVRVFANLTAGVLISGLLTPVIGINMVGTLFVGVGLTFDGILLTYSVMFVAVYGLVECFVGLIQTYVFVVLGSIYMQAIAE